MLCRAFALVAALAAGPAWAAGDTTVTAAGQRLAQQWCAECHVVTGLEAPPAIDDVPTFRTVANDPSVTELSLRAFLKTPHPPMPNFILAREQMDEIVAYILSLKGQ